MKKSSTILLGLMILVIFTTALLLLSSKHEEKKIEDIFYENPVINENTPDPCVIRALDGTYYLYATPKPPYYSGYSIYKSQNMVDWEYVGATFDERTYPTTRRLDKKARFWAPEVAIINNKYVLFYTMWFGNPDYSLIGYAISDTPEGPFNDKGILIDSQVFGVAQCIDQFYIKDDGKDYFFWGSHRNIFAMELEISADLDIIPHFETTVQVAGTAYEGSSIYKHNGFYYYIASIGGYTDYENSTYQTVVLRSKSILGPYLDRDNKSALDNGGTILIDKNSYFTGPGHNSRIVVDDAGQTWIYYHAYDLKNLANERQAMMERLMWSEDGWPFVEGSSPSVRAKVPFIKKK